MSAGEEEQFDLAIEVAAWVRAFELDDGKALVALVPSLSTDESAAAIVELVALCSVLLKGTGDRDPVDWLTLHIEDLRRRSDHV